MSIEPEFLFQQSRSADAVTASIADNCRFDERAGNARWQRFNAILAATVPHGREIEWGDWSEADRQHTERYCHVPSVSVPDAFLAINRRAWLGDVSPRQSVVRLEVLNRPLSAQNLDMSGLQDLLRRFDGNAHDADAHAAVRGFFRTWNGRRDARPSFVAFYDEVKEEAEADDWPHKLRDRLGLGHLGRSDGAPVPVALMRYSLETVLSVPLDHTQQTACALPAVLDGAMDEFFFSVPRECSYGATLHLAPDHADVLTAEIVHRRFDYAREHLWRLGWITRAQPLSDGELRVSRDFHLLQLRESAERQDFGEMFEGRV